MIYLFLQTWIWILLAGLFGLLIGWLIWGRACNQLQDQLDQSRSRAQHLESSSEAASLSASMDASSDVAETNSSSYPVNTGISPDGDMVEEVEVKDQWRPDSLDRPNGEPDDLKRIKGVGPVIQKTLNELGVYHFHQIAAFTEDNVRWVDNYIAFQGRIQREGWIAQAVDLAEGRGTAFSDRYDRRDVVERG